jgi:acetolactate synthase-1/3 small subunit
MSTTYNINRKYISVVYTEDKVGMTNRLTLILTRRKMNIESLQTSETEVPGIFRFTIQLFTTAEMIRKVSKQFEKVVDVISAHYYLLDDVIMQEVALYKVPTRELIGSDQIERLMRKHFARILYVEQEFLIIEKTGNHDEINALFRELEKYGLLEFVRSGTLVITKESNHIHDQLEEIARMQTT